MIVVSHAPAIIAQKDETILMLLRKLSDMTADRNEWREQHENLLAMYQAEVSKRSNSQPSNG